MQLQSRVRQAQGVLASEQKLDDFISHLDTSCCQPRPAKAANAEPGSASSGLSGIQFTMIVAHTSARQRRNPRLPPPPWAVTLLRAMACINDPTRP